MAKILDQWGNPIQQEVLATPQTARLASLHREYANHPSRGLTPVKLARIMDAAERGDLMAQTELFLDMEEKDGHIMAEMAKRKGALLNVPWSIVPPRNASTEEIKLADYLTELVSDLPGWNQLLFDMFDGIGHGFSQIEIEWERLGNEWFPKEFNHRPQSWFQCAQGNQNELRLRNGSGVGEALNSFGWISHRHRAKSGTLARSGLHRVLAWPYLFKNYAVRDLAELLEVYGMPLRLGKYPPGTDEREKATLLRAVMQLGHSAAGIIPEGMSIDFEAGANGNHDPFQAMMTWCELTESKVILGNTLSSQADGKTATNALGRVHNGARLDIRASDAEQGAETLTRDVLYPLAVLNGKRIENRRRMPKVRFDVREVEDFAVVAGAVKDLVEAGAEIPQSFVQKKLSIPARQKDEPILVMQSSSAAAPAVAANRAQQSVAALTQQAAAALPLPPADILAGRLEVESQAAWQAVLDHIRQLATRASSAEAFNTALLTAYSSLPQADLVRVMTEGYMVAHLAGMLDVKASVPKA